MPDEAQSNTEKPDEPKTGVMENVIIPVAGVSHYQDVVVGVKKGDPVWLRHCTAYASDPWAVQIYSTGVRNADGTPAARLVGFVPRTISWRFSDPQRGGVHSGTWKGTVVELTDYESISGLRVRIDEYTGTGDASSRYGHHGRGIDVGTKVDICAGVVAEVVANHPDGTVETIVDGQRLYYPVEMLKERT